MEKINLMENLRVIDKYWHSKIVGILNGQTIKLVKMKGEFNEHYHDREDELYLVLKGQLILRFPEKTVHLKEGELLIVPKGVIHLIHAEQEVQALIFEPKSTLNTDNVQAEIADTEKKAE